MMIIREADRLLGVYEDHEDAERHLLSTAARLRQWHHTSRFGVFIHRTVPRGPWGVWVRDRRKVTA